MKIENIKKDINRQELAMVTAVEQLFSSIYSMLDNAEVVDDSEKKYLFVVTDPHRAYIVSAKNFNDEFVAAHFGKAEPATPEQRDECLSPMLDPDEWTSGEVGKGEYSATYEDGSITVIEITG